jgi:hypothetical protein
MLSEPLLVVARLARAFFLTCSIVQGSSNRNKQFAELQSGSA